MKSTQPLKSKVALVTGSAGGIGRAIALQLAADGARVVINDIVEKGGPQSVRMIRKRGGKAIFCRADISSEADVKRMVAETKRAFGGLDILINNAGYYKFVSMMKMSSEVWKRTFQVELDGIFLLSKAFIPIMIRRGGGSIVNIASVHSQQTIPNFSAYAAAKSGIVALTRAMALEFGPKQVRVNTLSPGFIETPGLFAYFDSLPPAKRKKEWDYCMTWHPLGRFGKGEDIAKVVSFLCSKDAYLIHGAHIVVDGGLSCRMF
jgi:NAD(P)-dependent dehydrogenase (short-subunit alcohol dehydrogenase family)